MNGTPPRLTDRAALERFRSRARRRQVNFLIDAACDDLEERLQDVNKTFTAPLVIGPEAAAARFPAARHVPDRDALGLPSGEHDLILHVMALHWADDPLGQIVQSRLALRPDGLFLAVLPGGETLAELRSALAEAEATLTGGLSPRVAPMADVRSLGGLLQRAGLALPVADTRRLTVRYRDLAALVSDLRGMGESNALAARHRSVPPRKLFEEAERIYRDRFGDDEGYLPVTVDLVTLTGWAPAPSQPKPLRPGSASHRLADALGTVERPAGDDVSR